MLKRVVFLVVVLCGVGSVLADESWLELEVPAIDVAEYHRPYVAVWVQDLDRGEIHNLAVWYQVGKGGDKGDEKGEQWLKDMRQWWRRSGRSLDMPLDGVSGATRLPGKYRIALTELISALPAGNYKLYSEAAREVGGRELLELEFQLPVAKAATLTAAGSRELGALELHIAP